MNDPSVDFLTAPRTFVCVYRLPEKLTDGYCFGRGKPIAFQNVDWFETVTQEGRIGLVNFIRSKNYFDPKARFLVIADDPMFTFTIGPDPGQSSAK